MAFKHELKRNIRSYAKLLYFLDVAAAEVGVHAAVIETDPLLFPGPFTNPAIPRSLEVVFASGWAGGDVTIIGTNQFGAVQAETIVAAAGTTVQGVKVFKTVTSASKSLIAGSGTDICTLKTGTKIGILASVASIRGMVFCAGVSELVTLDITYNSFIPTTAPNGTNDYTLLVNINYNYIPLV